MALGEKALKRRQQASDEKEGIVRNSIALRKLATAKAEMVCASCKQVFLLTKSNADAKRHHQGKHDKLSWEECFPEIAKIEADLAAELAAEAAKPKAAPVVKKKASKKEKAADMDDLLSAGMATKKKGKGKGKK